MNKKKVTFNFDKNTSEKVNSENSTMSMSSEDRKRVLLAKKEAIIRVLTNYETKWSTEREMAARFWKYVKEKEVCCCYEKNQIKRETVAQELFYLKSQNGVG